MMMLLRSRRLWCGLATTLMVSVVGAVEAQVPAGSSLALPPSVGHEVQWQPLVDYAGDFFPAAALAFGPVRRMFGTNQPRMFPDVITAPPVVARPQLPPPPGTRWTPPPVMRVTQSHYLGDGLGLLGVQVRVSHVPARVRVVIDAPDLAAPSSLAVTLADSGATYELFPEMLYNDRRLKSLMEPTLSNVTFRVFVNDTLVEERVQRVAVRATTDVPFAYLSRQGIMQPQPWLFAAFVNEYHPAIDVILREALATGVVTSFSGYQQGDGTPVMLQVYAIWNALQRRGIHYSSIANAVPSVSGVYSENVRPLQDALLSSQANCVDGSVLFASILRKIGIDAFLVLIPGHMFVGYYRDARHQVASMLETTMMGNTPLQGLARDGSFMGDLTRALGGETRNSVSAKAFDAATDYGTTEYNRVLPALRSGRDPQYQIIDIARVRSWGIAPAR